MDRRAAAAVAGGGIDPGLAQRTRIMARLYGGGWVSGQSLADDLGISRAAIHKHVESLRASAAPIASVRGSGYRVTAPWDSLVPEAVLPLVLGRDDSDAVTASSAGALGLPSGALGLPYLYESETDSTNRVLKEAAAHAYPGGTVAVTDHQVQGRGRLDRVWVSEAGRDVTFSVLLRPTLPPEQASRLVLTAGVAVVEVVAGIVGCGADAAAAPSVTIKWPNDVLIAGRKVCGILSEASMDMDRLHWAVIGVGLNVNSRPSDRMRASESPPGKLSPVSLAETVGHLVPRGVLLSRLLLRLERRLSELATGRWEDIRAVFAASDALYGTPVSVCSGLTGEEVATGVAAGVGDLGQLLLRRDDGTVQSVTAGEVTVMSHAG